MLIVDDLDLLCQYLSGLIGKPEGMPFLFFIIF